MKKHLNPPQDAATFSSTYGIWQAAKAAILTGTVLSVIAEFTIVQSLIKEHGNQFFTNLPQFLPAGIAAVFVAILALERIKYGRQAGKLTTDPESRKLGVLANIVVFAACLFVFGISGVLSYIGSTAAVTEAIKEPTRQTTTQTDSTTAAKIGAIAKQYKSDSSSTAATWKARISTADNAHKAKISVLKRKIAAGKHWLKNELNEAENKQKDEIAALKAERAAALLRLQDDRQTEVKEIKSIAHTEVKEIQSSNTNALETYNFIKAKAGNLIPLISIGALITLLFGLFLDERFKYKAGIKEVVLISDYDGLPSLWSEYKEALTAVFSGLARKFAKWIKSLAPQAAAVLDENAAELVKIELTKYKEKVLNFSDGSSSSSPAASVTASAKNDPPPYPGIGYKTYKTETPPPPNNGNNDNNTVITELFNTYRIERQRLQVYRNKAVKQEGNPETIAAGIAKHGANLQQAAQKLQLEGYEVTLNKESRKLELIKIN